MGMTALECLNKAFAHYSTLDKTPDNVNAQELLLLAIEQLRGCASNNDKNATKQLKVEIFTGRHTLQQLNDWISKTPVRVISIETVLETSGGHFSDVKIQKTGTKVWYEELCG